MNANESKRFFGVRREAKRHAAFGFEPSQEKRCRRCALPPQSKCAFAAGFNAVRIFQSQETPGCRARRRCVQQSQRDCVTQPRVARNELPWGAARRVFNPNGVVPRFPRRAATPLGLFDRDPHSQGSSCLATLGCAPESRRDSGLESPKRIPAKLLLFG